MMQRLLFGPHRTDIPYDDLHRGETVSLLITLLMLVAVGLLPYGFLESDLLANGHRTTMEMTTSWIK